MVDTQNHQPRAESPNEWREGLLGAATIRAANWRFMAVGVTMALLLSLAGNLVLIVQYRHPPPIPPDVSVIDPQGNTLWHGAPGSYQIHDLWVSSRLKEWIRWCRARPDDLVVMGEHWDACRRMVVDGASRQIDRYLTEMDPKQPKYTQNPLRVQIPRIGSGSLQIKRRSAKLYEADWTETWTPKYGQRSQLVQVSGTFSIDWRPSVNALGGIHITSRDMNQSDMAVYITSFEWTQVLEEQP